MPSTSGPAVATLARSSALPRPIDLGMPSNRTAVFGALAFSVLPLLLGRSGRQALGVAGVSFLGWATARELDPDAPSSATLALGLAGLAALAQTEKSLPRTAPAVLPGFGMLSATRLLTGTVGHRASPQDLLALCVQAGASALGGHRAAALLPAAALALSAAEPDAQRPEADWGAPVALAAGLLPRLVRPPADERPKQVYGDLLSLAALALTRTVTAPEQPTSRCDQVPLTVSASRLRASRALALGALALGLLRRESSSLVPLAAATLATGLRRSLGASG